MWSVLDLLTFIVAPIAGGILAASGFIISKNPNAAQLIDKIAPYKGIIGAVMLGSGVWNLLWVLRIGIGLFFKSLGGIMIIVTLVTMVLVGLMLGFGLIAKYAGGAAEKGAELQKKLIAFEVPLGFLSIICGVFMLLLYLGIVKFI